MPICQHFGPCGGCDWQHLAYHEQLERKRRILSDLLRAALGKHAPQVEPTIGMPTDQSGWPWRFRHKASFVFGDDRGRLTIGHYAARSNVVVPIVECPVHAERANRIAFALYDHLARARINAAGKDLRGVLRHLLIRTTADEREAVAMLVVTRNEKALRAPIKKFLAASERPTGFYLNIHDRADPFMIGRETLKLDGHAYVREQVGGVSFLISPTAFFQTNVHAAATLVDLVAAHAPSMPMLEIADLYCGSGLFALALAVRGHRVTAVEENAQAVKDGEANLRLNRLPPDRVRFIASRIEDALGRLAQTNFDLAVIDPPRAGCPDSVLRALFTRGGPSMVCYVSCNPEALARELPQIIERGYRVRRVQPVDMFPHTTHIETVVSLGR